jgi:hypothetical protein
MMSEEKTYGEVLVEAFFDDDEETIESLVARLPSDLCASSDEMTPLMACVASGHYEYVDAILAKTGKSSIDAKSVYGSTALTLAASGNTPEAARAAEALINAGADVNAKDDMGWSVLSKVALNSPSLQLLELLLKKGAGVDHASDLGVTPLMAAAQRDDGNPAFVKALLENGADPEASTANGETALDLAREEAKKATKKEARRKILRLLEAPKPRKTSKTDKTFRHFHYFPAAAILLLSLGIAFIAGVTTGNPRALDLSTGGSWEAEDLYKGKIVETLNLELRAALEEEGVEYNSLLGTNAGWNLLCKVFDSKRDLDWRLEEIVEASGERVETVLGFPFLDVLRLDGNSAAVYGRLLKDNRTQEMELAAPWIRLDPNFYFSQVDKLPREVWSRYPAEEAYLGALTLISALPEDLKSEALKLSPEEARKIYKKEAVQNIE